MKITRCYASAENSVNVKNVIQDLLNIELESLINASQKDEDTDLPVPSQSLGRDCA